MVSIKNRRFCLEKIYSWVKIPKRFQALIQNFSAISFHIVVCGHNTNKYPVIAGELPPHAGPSGLGQD